MKILKLTKTKYKFFYNFSITKHIILLQNSLKLQVELSQYKPFAEEINIDYKEMIDGDENLDNENGKNSIPPLKLSRLKEIYKKKLDKRKIRDYVKKRLFEDDTKSVQINKLNDDLVKAELKEEQKKLEMKIKEIKENLVELQENLNSEQFNLILQEIYSSKLYYFDIITNLETLFNLHNIFMDFGMLEITREIIIYGVSNKIVRFKEQTFLKMIINQISHTKTMTFSQLNRFLTSMKRVEKYISSSNINEMYSVRLVNHIKKFIIEGNVKMNTLEDLYSFSFMIKNHREIFDNYYPVNEKLWNNLNTLLSENDLNMDLDSTLLSASLVMIYKDIYQNRVNVGLKQTIEVINNSLIHFFKNYDFLPFLSKEKLNLIIPNILHYYLNFIHSINSNDNDIVLLKILEVYQEKFESSSILLSKIDVENFYLLGRNNGIYEQKFFNKISSILTIKKISFPNEIVDKAVADDINPLLFNFGKFLYGFSQSNINNLEFWNKMTNKMIDLNISFGKKGSEFKFIYYYLFNIFKDTSMKQVLDLFTNSVFIKEFIDFYQSPELIEILATLPKEKNEIINKIQFLIINFEKMLKNQKNDNQLSNFINLINLLTTNRRDIFTSGVSSVVAKALISIIRNSNFSFIEIEKLLKSFNEIINSLYLHCSECFNEELVKELYSFISNCNNTDDFKKVLRLLYVSEIIDNLSLIKLNYFLELNGLNDKREAIIKFFPIINYEKTSNATEMIHNI